MYLRQRKSPRLQGYDYRTPGAYFVTVCTHQRLHLLGEIMNERTSLTKAGEMAAERWYAIPDHHSGVDLDLFVVMPNHIHGILVIHNDPIAPNNAATSMRAGSLSAIVGAYKSGVPRRVRALLDEPNLTIWQNSFYEHIIRNEDDLNRIREYILNNPARWEEDSLYASGG